MAKQLKKVLEAINDLYGDKTIASLGDTENLDIEYISTGVPCIDSILGNGIPRGRICEVYGDESCGKTTLTLKIISEAQKNGLCAFIDAEHALDIEWCKKLGVNVDTLILSQPDNAEQALDIVKRLIESERFSVIVVDSVAALVPRAELEGEIGDAVMGLQARLMSQTMRMLTASLKKSKTALIFINQQRVKIGVMFGNPNTTCGGVALKFYSSVRLSLTRKTAIKVKKEFVGIPIKAKVIKNKVNSPFKDCIFVIKFSGEIEEYKV